MKTMAIAALAMMVPISTMPSAAMAQSSTQRDDRVYRGSDSRDRYPCKGNNGAVGTVAGGVGGALLGHALGGGTLGTLAGAGGGALVGRHFDKKHTASENRKKGC